MDRHEQRLKRHQRRLARCQNGSANRAKAKQKVARAHARVADARRDFLHQASTSLVRRYDILAIEDLAVANMVRNRSLARAISRTGWAEFRRQLEYKAKRYGRTIVVADRWFPSSKTCSACGFVLAELSLGTRRWACPGCGTRHDRDINAAKNILAAGLAAAAPNGGDACGADIRHGQEPPPVQTAANQEPRPARAAIRALHGGE
jgi:putative transposase